MESLSKIYSIKHGIYRNQEENQQLWSHKPKNDQNPELRKPVRTKSKSKTIRKVKDKYNEREPIRKRNCTWRGGEGGGGRLWEGGEKAGSQS